MMRSNCTNLPGRKKTFVMPNLKSLLFNFKECNIAWNINFVLNNLFQDFSRVILTSQKIFGCNLTSSGGKNDLYMLYNSANGTRDGYPYSISSSTDVVPELLIRLNE